MVCSAPNKASVIYSSSTALIVRLNTFDITTAGLSVAGTAGTAITIEQIAAALTNITSSGTGVNLTSVGGAGNLSLSYQSGTINAGTTGVSAVAAGTGNVGVNFGAAATVNAGTNRGLLAQSASGNVSVTNAGTIRSTSNAGIDARVNAAGAGSVTVVSSGNIAAGTSAILATNAGNGGIAISMAAGTNLAAGTAQGISAVDSGTAGGIIITADGTIGATTNVGGVGILANVNSVSNTGAIAINTGGTISATGDAIRATNAGFGNVSVNIGAAATSVNGSGVVATAARGDVSVEVAANIQGRSGIAATSSSTAGTGKIDVTVDPGVSIISTAGIALTATSAGSQGVTVLTGAGSTVQSSGGAGITTAVSGPTGGISIETHGTVASLTSSAGISAAIGNTNNTVNPGSIDIDTFASVAGATTGISAGAYGAGNVTIDTHDVVTGGSLEGIAATARLGGNVVVTNNAQVRGQRNGLGLGVSATNQSTANVNADVTGVTQDAVSVVSGGLGGTTVNIADNVILGANRFGILALAGGDGSTLTGIAGDVTVNTGSNVTIATNTWNAIDAEAYGGGDVFVTTGTGSMRGTNAIYASSGGGAGTVNVDTSGDLTGFNNSTGGAGHGIWAVTSSLGGIEITTAAGALITADTDGILATGTAVAGGITINEGSAIDAATGNGIEAELTASGNNDGISLTSHAIVSGQTNGANLTTAGTGPIDVTNSGTLQGQDGVGLAAQTTSGIITIDTSGLVLGRVAGVSLSGGASQLDNAGTIRNLSGLSSDLAIKGDGGATAIGNTNLVTGTVDLGDFGNSFTNSGIWNTANGTNSFGALTPGNSVMNTGTIIAANNPAAVQTTVFDGLNTFTNAGALTMQDGLAGDRTVVSGNYVGGQGGTVLLDTYLGTDGSPSDLLHIQGNTAGSSFLRIANAGGPGALTTSDGIQVVQVDGASDGLFSLLSDYAIAGQRAVVGGAYAYTLWKNGVTTPTDGDWYLRSQLSNPVIPGEPEPPVDPGKPTPPEGPLYQAGVPSYEAYPQVLQSLNGLPTLQQRLRNRYWSAAGDVLIEQGDGPGIAEATPSPDGSESVGDRGVWGRIEGVHSRFDPKVSTSSTDYDIDTFWMQAGLDGQFYESDAGRLIGGITVHYGHARADVSSFYGNGDINTDGYGFGGNLTWYGTNGFYIDGQAEMTWYDSDLSSQLAERSLADGNNGFGYALSLETGKRIDIDGNWTITPQAQLVYSAVDFDSFNDPFGARVSLDRGDSLTGRLGLSIDRENSWYGGNGQISRSHIYGIANLYYEFLDGSRVDVDRTKISSRDNRIWGGVGIGGSYNWNGDKYSVYGEGAVNTSLADFGDSYAIKGTVGFRVKW